MSHSTANGAERELSHGTRAAEAEIFLSAFFGREESERDPGEFLRDLRVQLTESTTPELRELYDAAQMLISEVEREQERRRK